MFNTIPAALDEKVARLQKACSELAARCDGAIDEDGKGFNGGDARFGHDLAERETWTYKQARYAAKMLQKYSGQLAGYGVYIGDISVDDFPEEIVKLPAAEEKPEKPKKYIDFEDGVFKVHFEYWAPTVAKVKSYKGATYGAKHFNDPNCRFWVFVPQNGYSVQQLARECDFELTDAAREALLNPVAESNEPELPANRIERFNDKLVLIFDYDPSQVAAVKNIPGREFNKIPSKYPKAWSLKLNANNVAQLAAYIAEFKPHVAEDISGEITGIAREAAEAIEQSKAQDADIEIDYGVELFPFQRAGVQYALKKKRTFIADEMGLGKTHQSIATVYTADAFPCLVICPASVKLNWQREIFKGTRREKSVSIWNGQAGSDRTDFIVINYDVLKKHKDALLNIPFKSVIFDESHYCKNYKAKRTEIATELAKGKEFVLCLTGTPVMNRPQELLSQLGLMRRLDDVGGFWHFVKRYCNAFQQNIGRRTVWNFSGAANLEELNEKLRASCFVRRRKADVFSEMPQLTRAEVTVSITNPAEYSAAEQDVISFLKNEAQKNKEFLASIKDLPEDEQKAAKAARADDAAYKAARAEALVKINTLKVLAARGKLEAIKDWTESFLESGEKLVIFAEHIEVQKMLIDAFPGAARVFGDDNGNVRQENVDRFQSDESCRLIVCSLQAGGTGIDGLQKICSNVAFCEQGWTPAIMNQAAARLDRFGQKFPVTAWYLLAENTIDLAIKTLLDTKQKVCDAATDGAPEIAGKSIFGELVREMLKS